MELEYMTAKAQKYCSCPIEAKKQFGPLPGEKLIATINFLKAAKTLQDIEAMNRYRLHHLEGKLSEYLSITVMKKTWRLLIKPVPPFGADVQHKDMATKCRSVTKIAIKEMSKHYE